MTTATLTLAAFLGTRVAEDEAAASLAQREGQYPHYGETAAEETLAMALSEGCDEAGAEHFARHDPARVLAEVAAKRAIVALADWEGPVNTLRERLVGPAVDEAFRRGIDMAVRHLAAVYADHPDYDESWRP